MRIFYSIQDMVGNEEVRIGIQSQNVPQKGTKVELTLKGESKPKKYKVYEINEKISYSAFSNSYRIDEIEVVLIIDRGGLH